MEEDQDKPSDAVTSNIPKPVIPPPDLSRPAPGPPSPLDHLPKPSIAPPAAPIPVSNSTPPAIKKAVVEDTEEEEEEEDEVPTGTVPFNTRLIAGLIDVVVGTGLYITAMVLLPGFIDSKVAFLLNVGYLLTRDSLPFLGGQSVGKKAMKIQVVTLDGKSLVNNWQPALVRNGVLLIPLFSFVELFLLLTREEKPERGRRLGDEWAKTKVIFERKPGADLPKA